MNIYSNMDHEHAEGGVSHAHVAVHGRALTRRNITCASSLLVLLGVACGGQNSSGSIETAPREVVDVVCDPPVCNAATLESTVRPLLSEAAGKPGHGVQVWIVGRTAAETAALAPPLVYQEGSRKDQNAVASRQRRFVREGVASILETAAPHLKAPGRKASPLVESIAKVGAAGRRIVVISDMREVTRDLGDLECRIPSARVWARGLRKAGLFDTGSLQGAHIDVVHMDLTPVDANRCRFSMKKLNQIQQLWTTALTAAGATVQYHRGELYLHAQGEK